MQHTLPKVVKTPHRGNQKAPETIEAEALCNEKPLQQSLSQQNAIHVKPISNSMILRDQTMHTPLNSPLISAIMHERHYWGSPTTQKHLRRRKDNRYSKNLESRFTRYRHSAKFKKSINLN